MVESLSPRALPSSAAARMASRPTFTLRKKPSRITAISVTSEIAA